MTVPVSVREGECPCPGAPHTVEVIELESELLLTMAAAAMAMLNNSEATVSAQQAGLTASYLPAGIVSWTFVEIDPDVPLRNGKPTALRPVPITTENMERLVPWDMGGMELVEAADGLYSGKLMRPLLRRIAKRSEIGQTEQSTSPIPEPSSDPPVQSSPSSLANTEDGSLSVVPVP